MAVAHIALSGCGILGEKEEPAALVSITLPAEGCFNELGDRVRGYFRGEVAKADWDETWRCLDGSLESFTQMTRGSVPDGYTREDMRSFSSRFLVTDREVSRALIDATFDLKATLLGGTNEVLTEGEIHEARRLFGILGRESAALIPLFREYHAKAGLDPGRKLGEAIDSFRTTIAGSLKLDGHAPLSSTSIETLLVESSLLHQWSIPIAWLAPGFSLKALLIGGEPGSLRADEVLRALELASRASAALLSHYGASPEERAKPESARVLVERIAAVLSDVPSRHDGAVPLQAILNLADQVALAEPDWAGPIRDAKALLGPAKELLLGGRPDSITSGEWALLARTAAAFVEPARVAKTEWAHLGKEAEAGRRIIAIGEIYRAARALLSVLPARGGGELELGKIGALVRALPKRLSSPWLAGGGLDRVLPWVKRVAAGGEPGVASQVEWEAILGIADSALSPILELCLLQDAAHVGRALSIASALARAREKLAANGPVLLEDAWKLWDALTSGHSGYPVILERHREVVARMKSLALAGPAESVSWRELDAALELAALVGLPARSPWTGAANGGPGSPGRVDPEVLLAAMEWVPRSIGLHQGAIGVGEIRDLVRALGTPNGEAWVDFAANLKILLVGGEPSTLDAGDWGLLAPVLRSEWRAILRLASGTIQEADLRSVLASLSRLAPLRAERAETRFDGSETVALGLIEKAIGGVPGWDAARLVQAIGPVKALLLGGDPTAFSPEEWQALFRALGDGAGLLARPPRLGRDAGADLGSDSSTELERVFSALGPWLRSVPARHGGEIRMERVTRLLEGVGAARGIPGERLPEIARAVKQLLVSGSADSVSAGEWATLLALVREGAPPVLELARERWSETSGALDFAGRAYPRLERIASATERVFDAHQGAIALGYLDAVVDSIPRDRIGIDPEAIKKTFRPFAKRVLRSKEGGMEHAGIRALLARMRAWMGLQAQLEETIRFHGLDPAAFTRKRFVNAAESCLAGEPDPARKLGFRRLIHLAQDYPVFRIPGYDRPLLTAGLKSSLETMTVLLLVELGAEALLEGYGSVTPESPGKEVAWGGSLPLANVKDLAQALDDFDDLGFAFKIVQPRAATFASRRIREADLFMFTSDGDGLLGLGEATEYIAFAIAGVSLGQKLGRELGPICHDRARGYDDLELEWMEPRCFRAKYYGNFEDYWDHIPHLRAYWLGLDAVERQAMIEAIEGASRLNGFSDDGLASYDLQSLVGIIHSIELIFLRFDLNLDGAIDEKEAELAFPVYRKQIAVLAGIPEKKEGQLLAIFTYMLKHGRPPDCSPKWKGAAQVLGWSAKKAFWKIRSDRATVFRLVSLIVSQQNTAGGASAALCGGD